MSEEFKVAEWLGLRGGCSDRQKGAVVEFLEQIDRKGSEGLKLATVGTEGGGKSRGCGGIKGAAGETWGIGQIVGKMLKRHRKRVWGSKRPGKNGRLFGKGLARKVRTTMPRQADGGW